MASNPMQKKSRNSFLLGMLLMLIIAAIAIVIIVVIMSRNNNAQEQASTVYVYRLKQSIKSGETITSSDVEIVEAMPNTVPTGVKIAKEPKVDQDGNVVKQNGEIVWNTYGFAFSNYKAKIDLNAGTIVSQNMLYENEELQASERIQEYNMLQLPIQLDIGEYVDVRFQLSNGQDYIVVSHKEVIDISENTIWLQLSEEEILLMSNAMVESYISPASNLYVNKYVEPGMQTAASITYVPSAEVVNLIQQDANIVQQAKAELINRYNSNLSIRNYIQTEIDKFSEENIDNIQDKMLESREKAQEAREEFLNGVN